MISTEFLLTSLIVVLMPGTGVLYTVSAGLFKGRRASIAAAFGCTIGIVPHLLASVLGLSAIFHVSSLAFHTVKYIGVAYLLYLVWSMWRETGALQLSSKDSTKNLRQIAVRAFLTLQRNLTPRIRFVYPLPPMSKVGPMISKLNPLDKPNCCFNIHCSHRQDCSR